MKLWIDDLREPPDDSWVWAKTSAEAISEMEAYTHEGMLWVPREVISFDHDLGGDDTTRPVLMWMIDNQFRFDEYRFHTSNPVGHEWLKGTAERYLSEHITHGEHGEPITRARLRAAPGPIEESGSDDELNL